MRMKPKTMLSPPTPPGSATCPLSYRASSRSSNMSDANDPIVIVAAARTPIAAFQGDFTALSAPQLGAAAIEAAVQRAGLKPEQIDEAVMGCVLPAGQGQAPARQAAL